MSFGDGPLRAQLVALFNFSNCIFYGFYGASVGGTECALCCEARRHQTSDVVPLPFHTICFERLTVTNPHHQHRN